MNFNVKKIYKLEANKDLHPGHGIIPAGSNPIKAIHCITSPNAEVVIRLTNGEIFNFPPHAFVQGAIYPYEIRQVNEVASDCFLGLSD
jgi:hypothetical protein